MGGPLFVAKLNLHKHMMQKYSGFMDSYPASYPDPKAPYHKKSGKFFSLQKHLCLLLFSCSFVCDASYYY